MALLKVAVLVPAVTAYLRAGQLNKPNPPLDHPSGQQAFGAKNLRRLIVTLQPIGPLGAGGFASQIE